MKGLLCQEIKSGEQDILKKKFCDLVVNVLFPTTRSFSTLLHVAQKLFPIYLEPVLSKCCTAEDSKILYERIIPHLLEVTNSDNDSGPCLPKRAKYLLGAAFLASSNPPSSDNQMFKTEGQLRKNSKKRIRSRQKLERERRCSGVNKKPQQLSCSPNAFSKMKPVSVRPNSRTRPPTNASE